MKKTISLFLSVVFLLSSLPAALAAEAEHRGEASVSTGRNLDGELYDEIFGDGSPFQVVSIAPVESGDGLAVSYAAEHDTSLTVTVTDDDSGEQVLRTELPAPQGEHTLLVEADLKSFPAFYRIDAALSGGGQTFTSYDHTHAMGDFLALTPDDSAFSDRVVVNYGADSAGQDNFVVVREDVKVVRVADMDDVLSPGSGTASLMGLMDSGEGSEYRFSDLDGESSQVLSGLESGDKLLILPLDNEAEARALVVGNVEGAAALLSEGGVPEVTVTSETGDGRLEDFFDVVRIRAEVEADAGSIDTSGADADLEISVVEDGEAVLQGSKTESKRAEKKAQKHLELNKTVNGVTVKDSFTLSVHVVFTVYYKALTLQSVNMQASLSSHNNFTISSSRSVRYSNSWNVGTIYLGSVSGVNFTVPVYVTFYVDLGGSFSYKSYQDASLTLYASYNGSCSCPISRSVSVGRSVSANASATARLGVKASVQASPAIIPLYVAASGEAGVEVQGSVRNRKFSGNLYGYAQPSISLRWRNRNLAGRTWPASKWKIASTSSWSLKMTMQELAAMDQAELQKQLNQSQDGMEVSLSSPGDLRLLAGYTNAGKLTKGIRFVLDAEGGSVDMGGGLMTPIGTADHPFQGEFDGNKTTVLGAAITGGENIGLFGVASGAEIHDIILRDAEIDGGSSGSSVVLDDQNSRSAGGIVGTATGGTWIYDTAVSGLVSGAACAGGIAGTLRHSALLNSISSAQVSGTDAVGGIVGAFIGAPAETDTLALCQVANCAAVGSAAASSGVPGGICGSVKLESVPESVDLPQTGCTDAGIAYCYYLTGSAAQAAGSGTGVPVKAWPVTAAQARGTETAAMIDSAEGSYAHAATLLEALNRWYAVYGAHQQEGGDIPPETVADAYNKWYADDPKTPANGGCPVFASRQDVYPLRVSFVDEEGNELFPSVSRSLQWGEKFRVDIWKKDGFHVEIDSEILKEADGQQYLEGYMTLDMMDTPKPETDESGLIPDFSGLEFRLVYVKDNVYADRASTLGRSGAAAKSGSVYEVRDAEDLLGLSAYAAAGGSTAGAAFEQTEEIDMSGKSWTPIASFGGRYQGNTLAIQNLSGPLFDGLDGAEVREVKLTGSKVSGGTAAGGLTNTAKASTLEGCTADGTVQAADGAAGVLAGTADGCTVRNCSTSGTVQSARSGGLVGAVTGGKYVNCASTASVTGSELAGGLAGSVTGGADIRNCYASGTVTGGTLAGGLAGRVDSGTLLNSFASGSVSGDTAGAVAGEAGGGASAVNVLALSGKAASAVGAGNSLRALLYDAVSAGYRAMLDRLNAWVSAAASGEYRTWTASETKESGSEEGGDADMELMAAPVFGDAYSGSDARSGWLTDLTLEDGQVSFRYDSSVCAGATVTVCVYDGNGRLITAEPVKEGDTGFPVGADASKAAAFLLDEALAPIGVVRTA